MRKPGGFTDADVPSGALFVQERAGGRWVVLAGDPMVKIDNCDRDGIAHLHPGGWHGGERWPLKPGLRLERVVSALRHQLAGQGYLDVERLREELS